jgi:hypothetical protein
MYVIIDLVPIALTPTCELVPALEPEFTCPAVEEHATFAEAIHNLEHYLEHVNAALRRTQTDHAVAGTRKAKGQLSMLQRSRHLIEELCEPMFIHVSARMQPSTSLTSLDT